MEETFQPYTCVVAVLQHWQLWPGRQESLTQRCIMDSKKKNKRHLWAILKICANSKDSYFGKVNRDIFA